MLGRSSHLVLFFSDDVSLAALTTFRHHPNICKLQINIQFSKHWILSKFYSMLRVWGFMEVELELAGYSCWKSLLAGNNFYSGGPSGRGGDPRWEIATNRFCTCTCTYICVHCTYIYVAYMLLLRLYIYFFSHNLYNLYQILVTLLQYKSQDFQLDSVFYHFVQIDLLRR